MAKRQVDAARQAQRANGAGSVRRSRVVEACKNVPPYKRMHRCVGSVRKRVRWRSSGVWCGGKSVRKNVVCKRMRAGKRATRRQNQPNLIENGMPCRLLRAAPHLPAVTLVEEIKPMN